MTLVGLMEMIFYYPNRTSNVASHTLRGVFAKTGCAKAFIPQYRAESQDSQPSDRKRLVAGIFGRLVEIIIVGTRVDITPDKLSFLMYKINRTCRYGKNQTQHQDMGIGSIFAGHDEIELNPLIRNVETQTGIE